MQHNPVGWFEIYVQDMPRARAFYEGMLGSALTPMQNPDATVFADMEMCSFPSDMASYGAAGALVRMGGCPSGGSTLVYFSCEDCANELARAVAHGGKVFRPKTSIGEHGFIALVEDTEGNMVGLHSLQ